MTLAGVVGNDPHLFDSIDMKLIKLDIAVTLVARLAIPVHIRKTGIIGT